MKVTINDKDYYSDDFTPDQLQLFNQIQTQQQFILPFQHALESMQAVLQGYTAQLAASLEEPVEEEKPKPEPKRKPRAKKA